MLMANESRAEVIWDAADYPDPEQWCMIATRPSKEMEAANCFRRRNIRAYFPNFPIWPRYAPRKSARPRPTSGYRALIPGYIFCPLPTGQPLFWDIVQYYPDLVTVVRTFSGDIVAISNRDITDIKHIEKDLNTPKPGRSLHNFKTGQKVRFADDLLSRWPPGVVSRVQDDGRIVVQTDVFGRKVPFVVFPHQIEYAA